MFIGKLLGPLTSFRVLIEQFYGWLTNFRKKHGAFVNLLKQESWQFTSIQEFVNFAKYFVNKSVGESMNLRQKNKNWKHQRQIIQIILWPCIDEPSMLQPFLPEHLCCRCINTKTWIYINLLQSKGWEMLTIFQWQTWWSTKPFHIGKFIQQTLMHFRGQLGL